MLNFDFKCWNLRCMLDNSAYISLSAYTVDCSNWEADLSTIHLGGHSHL